jgi:hypothetical protein
MVQISEVRDVNKMYIAINKSVWVKYSVCMYIK